VIQVSRSRSFPADAAHGRFSITTAGARHLNFSWSAAPAELAAGIDMLVVKREFADQPHDLLDVE